MLRRGALAVALICASPAIAGKRFVAYEGKDQIIEAGGGTRVTKGGVDFWTSGTPTKRAKVIGRISDSRGTGPLHGEAVGSSGVAKLVRKNGGDAVMILGGQTSTGGLVFSGNAAVAVNKVTTDMLVLKYVD